MAWVRLEDTFPEHPKVDAAGGDAAWLHVCALAYCNRAETDGFIPADRLIRLSDRPRPRQLAAKLVKVGLWEPADGGWKIHDYLHYQPSKASREAERSAARDRMRTAREARTGSGNVRPNIGRTSREVRLTPTRPDPTRPDEQVRDHSTSEMTGPPDGDNSRFDTTVTEYARLALTTAEQRGPVRNADAYRRKARSTVIAMPELASYLDMFPTAPAGAVACWLHGDKHSMANYPRADELDGDLAPVINLPKANP